MLQNTSPIYIFTESDYDSSSPKFIKSSDFPRDLRFATKIIPLKLSHDNTNHGVITIEIRPSDNVDYGCVSFVHPNGAPSSVSTNKNGLYIPADSDLMNVNVFKKDGVIGEITYHIIVNSDQTNTSDTLLINIGLGQYKVKDEPSSVYIKYGCPDDVYSYDVGMHVYSPYDSFNTPKLRTKLYSFTKISDWTTNTLVYSSPFFSNPALPYYYGYGRNVYKVGGELDRAFGTTTYYRTVKKNAFAKTKTTTITDGPRSYYNSDTDTSPACVIPKMSDIGKIKEIILSASTSLINPESYRYYLGYDDNVIDDSSKNTFTLYSFSNKSHYPIVGSLHALIKLGSGLVNGYDSSETDWRKILSIKGMSGIMTWKSGANFAATGAALGIGVLVVDIINIGAGWHLMAACGCQTAVASILGMNVAPGIGTILAIVGLVILVFTVVIKLFKKTTITTKEDCKIFLHRYTPSPYIEIGDILSDKTNSAALPGFYCDGIYYYTPDDKGTITITGKTQCSGIFYDYFQEGTKTITQSSQSSIMPDDPTLVTSWERLIILPYISGKPEPKCSGAIYYNTLKEKEIPDNSCDLEIFTSSKITIPAGQVFSCISPLDASDKANILLESSYEFAVTHGNYSESIPDIYMGILDSKYTNISWVEFGTTKSPVVSESVRLFFDNRDTFGLTVGRNVYLDPSGCNKALKGFYTGAPYGGTIDGSPSRILPTQPIKTYQVESGKIIRINNETRTNSFYPSYISNWFLTDTSITSLTQTKLLMDDSRTFDPTTLESNDKCYQGLVKKTSSDYSSINDLLIFSGGSYVSAPEGFYLPLIDWINYTPFYYSKPDEIILNISENCDDKTSKGFYIVGVSKTTNTNTPTHNEVSLSVDVKSGNKTKTYTATTSPTLSKTLIPYGTYFSSSDIISEITINSIITKSPLNNITYTIGSTYLCKNNNVIVIPCGEGFNQISIFGKGYYEMTTNIGTLTGITSLDFDSAELPDRFQIYWDNKLVCDSLFIGNKLFSDERQYYIDEIIKVKSLNRYIYENNGWRPHITPIINVSFDLRDIASDGDRFYGTSTPSPQIGVDKYYGVNIADGNIRLKFNKTTSSVTTIRIVSISPIGGSNWSIDKLRCFTPPNIIPFKYRLKSDSTLSPDNRFGFVFNDTRDSISFSKCNEFKLLSPYTERTASLQIKSSTGGVPITLTIYKNDIFFSSVTSTTIENEWSKGGTLLSSLLNCENVTDYYTFNVDYTQPMTYVARVFISTKHITFSIDGKNLGVLEPVHNFIAQEIGVPTPTPTQTPTHTPTRTPKPTITPTLTPTPTKIPIILNADYVVFTYSFSQTSGQDLDTLTTLYVNGETTPYAGSIPVGYCKQGSIRKSGKYGGPYLWWGGDNTSSTGLESVYVDIKKLKLNGSITSIQLNCKADWYGQLKDGVVGIKMSVYSGGEMISNGNYGFKNTIEKGSLLCEYPFDSFDVYGKGCSDLSCVGLYTYNILTGEFSVNFNCLS
jgi:hypothetical protein